MHSIMQSKARVKVLKLIFWAIECKNECTKVQNRCIQLIVNQCKET